MRRQPQWEIPDTAESLGVITVSYDCLSDTDTYDPDIGQKLCGGYDGRPFLRILSEDGVADENDAAAIGALLARAKTDRKATQEKRLVSLRTADGRTIPFTAWITGDYAADGTAERLRLLLTAAGDLADDERIAERVLRDDLTGLLRRRAFLACVEERVAAAPPSTYIMVSFDVDKFSVINDRYGHRQGDALLCFIANTIADACSREDAVCARLDADHFAICAKNDDGIAERFLKRYREALRERDDATEVSVSFGLCVIDDPAMPPEVVLDHATLAQRSIKGSYVTRYAYYDDALRQKRLRRQEIEGQMTAALQRGQFDIYIQPQYELATGGLSGGEALVRWFHPEWGIVMPGEFIPIFEKNGFIGALDAFVWERACRQLQKWIVADGEEAALPLSVNLSRVNLRSMDIVETLCTLTARYGVPPRLLHLEITESAYADSPQQLIDVVRALQGRGFTVEMDDFGSGYSSLNTLKDVPANALKLDLRFLAGDAMSGRGGSIVNSVIRMARWLELPVIAEGVETQQQADYLRSVGCDYAQGYLYAKPLPVAEYEALLHSVPAERRDEPSHQVDMADANAFWNPDSQETLIFNSYVGGAAIMEYADGHVELLRANEKFLDIMQMETIARDVYLLEKTMPREDHARFLRMLDEAIDTGDETTCTACLSHDAQDGGRWMRSRARVLCRSRNRTIFYIAVEDITAEREAQQRFHISQNTLMAAAAHTHLQYWMYDLVRHTSIQGVESHAYRSGVPAYLENYPDSLLELGYIHPDHVDAYRKLHTDLQAGARTVALDALTGGEGHWEWRKIRYTAVTDDDGAVRRAIGTSESLSAYKELEQRFMIAVQQCGLLTWTVDLNARCIHTDMLAQSGTMEETLIEDMPEAFIRMGRVHPEDAAAFRDLYERMYGGAAQADATLRCREARGGGRGWRWYRIAFTAVADKDGRTGVAVGTGMDVTEQVNMQLRYREAMAYYEALDPKDYVGIVHVNLTKGVCEVPGMGAQPYAEGIKGVVCITDAAERADVEATLRPETLAQEYAKGVSRIEREYRMRFADGSERWVRTTVRLLMDTSRQELCAFIYTQDVNEEKMKALVFSRIVLQDYDFVTIIDTVRDRYLTFVMDEKDTFIPSADQYTFSEAAEIFAQRTAPEEDALRYIRETRFPYMMRRLAGEGGYSFRYHERQADGSLREKRIALKLLDPRTKHVCMTRQDMERLAEERI